MANPEQNNNTEQQSQQDFQRKYENVKRELEEVIQSKDNDERQIDASIVGTLDSEFGKALLKAKNPTRPSETLADELQRGVTAILNNPKFKRGLNQGSLNALKRVSQFLIDIKNSSSSVKDFNEFKDRINNPNTLSKMNEDQIRRVCLHLEGNEDDALGVYKQIKEVKVDVYNSLGKQDKKFFNDVLHTIRDKYSNSDKFFVADFGEIKATTGSLKDFIKKYLNVRLQTERDGKDIKATDVTPTTLNSSIVSDECISRNFNKANQDRIAKNKNYVLNNLKLKGVNFSNDASIYFSLAKQVLDFKSGGDVDLANDGEAMRIIQENYSEISEKLGIQIKQEKTNQTFGFGDERLKSDHDKTVFDAVQELTKDNRFIDRADNGNVTYYPDKAAAYLKKLNGEGESRDYYKKLSPDKGERQAWIAAVQVLLNNDEEVLSKFKNKPLTVNGNFERSSDNETYLSVMEFQKIHSETFGESKGRGRKVDGLPGPVTIDELIKNQSNIVAGERADLIQSKISGLSQLDLSEFGQKTAYEYGIPDKNITIYRKEGDNDNIYYRQGNDIFKISKEKPWEKYHAELDDKSDVTWESSKLHVCPLGAKGLENELKKLDSSISVSVSGVDYKLTLGDGNDKVNINMGIDDPVVYKAEDFCGKTEMVDRFKLVALAAKVKKEVGNVGVKSSGLGIVKEDSNGDPNTTLMNFNELGVYGLDQSKVEEFITYCNSLGYDDTNKNYFVPLS